MRFGGEGWVCSGEEESVDSGGEDGCAPEKRNRWVLGKRNRWAPGREMGGLSSGEKLQCALTTTK